MKCSLGGIALSFSILIFTTTIARADQVDCSEAYNGQTAKCIRVSCDSKTETFLGVWNGPFRNYVRELSDETKAVFRPFENTITYDESDCLKNVATGETFIIGRRTDIYPAFQTLPAKNTQGLLITGKRSDGSPFLRTVDAENGTYDYQLEYQNSAASMSIWSLTIPASGNSPEMKFVTIDGQDFTQTKTHKRNVTVTMTVGPASQPVWEGVVATGFHSLKK